MTHADETARTDFITFALAHGIGGVAIAQAAQLPGGYAQALAQMPLQLRLAARGGYERVARACADIGASMFCQFDNEYPAALRDLSDPPPVIFVSGDLAVLQRTCVSIVGTRSMTRYGRVIAAELTSALARHGVCVVSGLARGVDSVAHTAALDCNGATCAVLGTGLDVSYPASNHSLQRRIAEQGLLITEMTPGARPNPGSFPKRNRLIAALASTTIVVEAGRKSGALITASHALELGRSVAAIPGPIDAPHSLGTNGLIRDGAHVIAEIADALTLVGISTSTSVGVVPELSPLEARILRTLAGDPRTLEDLIQQLGAPVEQALAAVTALEINGLVECGLTGELACSTSGRRTAAGVV